MKTLLNRFDIDHIFAQKIWKKIGRGRNCKIWKERSHDPWDIILQRDETEIDKNGDTQKSFKIIATGRKAQKANLSMGSCFDVNFGPTFCSYFC